VESVWSARKLWDPTSRSRAGHGASTISAVHCGPATLGDLYAALDEARVARGHGELTVVDPTTFREAVLTSPLLPFERRAALGLLAENRRVGSDLFRLTHRTFRNPTAGDVSPREALRGMVRGLIRSAGACP
jgi:hypothetical protein